MDGLTEKLSDQDGFNTIYNTKLIIVELFLEFKLILCKQEKSLKMSKYKLNSIIKDIDKFTELMHVPTQSQNWTKGDTNRTNRSPLSVDLNDIVNFIFWQDNTEFIATHMRELEQLTNQNVHTEIAKHTKLIIALTS